MAIVFMDLDPNSALVVDHIDQDLSHDSLDNLQVISFRSNCRNSIRNPFPGAYPFREKWRSSINIQRKRYDLGTYPTQEEASQAYLQARENWEELQIKP